MQEVIDYLFSLEPLSRNESRRNDSRGWLSCK